MKTVDNIDKYLNESKGISKEEKKTMGDISKIEKSVFKIIKDLSKMGKQNEIEEFSDAVYMLDNIIDELTEIRDKVRIGFINNEGEGE